MLGRIGHPHNRMFMAPLRNPYPPTLTQTFLETGLPGSRREFGTPPEAVAMGTTALNLPGPFHPDSPQQHPVIEIGRPVVTIADRPSLTAQPLSQTGVVMIFAGLRIGQESDDRPLGQFPA